MPTHVWLLRHAETAVPTVFHGSESDIGLSERGARRADVLGPVLAVLGADAVVASGMKRAIRTAAPIALAARKPLRIERDLHERRVGILSGTPTVPEGPLWKETAANWEMGRLDFTTEGAESFADVQNRVLPVWERLTAEYMDRKLIVVAHGLVIKILLLSILPNWSPTNWKKFPSVSNLAVTELLRDNGSHWRIERLCEVPACVRHVE